MDDQIIIIGAGAAGLIAARELLRKGRRVTLLEATGRTGGRIFTLETDKPLLFEAGAEFVHGDLPLTLKLLREYRIGYYPTGWSMVAFEEGKLKKQDRSGVGWEELLKKMKGLRADIPLLEFLDNNFSGVEHAELRRRATRFAEGFDVADTRLASTKALFEEWTKEEGGQYRISGGYSKLTDALAKECLERGCRLITSEPVVRIGWKKNTVNVFTRTGSEFSGCKTIITAPLAVLDQQLGGGNGLTILPEIPRQLEAAAQIGYGSVIKILLEFNQPFWEARAKKARFIITDELIPTWWTQYPHPNHLLTGWIGGPRALELKHKTDEMILLVAQLSLSSVFGLPYAALHSSLIKSAVFNWGKFPYSLGAYSYPMLGTAGARKLLNSPVEETIFFAGEAVYSGSSQGTVEAALASGLGAARSVLRYSS